MNIIEAVNAFLLTKYTPYAPIRQNAFQAEGVDEIITRIEPSNAEEARYLSGTRAGVLIFSYIAKSRDQEKAMHELTEYKKILDGANVGDFSDGNFNKMDVITEPQFLGKTEHGEYTFSFSVSVDYTYTKGE